MLNQEELNKMFPPASDDEPRYVVTWCKGTCDRRSIVNVFDKFVGRNILRDDTTSRKKVYAYIQTVYGKNNCVAPREVSEAFMNHCT